MFHKKNGFLWEKNKHGGQAAEVWPNGHRTLPEGLGFPRGLCPYQLRDLTQVTQPLLSFVFLICKMGIVTPALGVEFADGVKSQHKATPLLMSNTVA